MNHTHSAALFALALLACPSMCLSGSPPPRLDSYGDPLPPSAVARIGTVRFRESDVILSLAYSPDSKMLASGTGNSPHSLIRLWDAATGKQLLLLQAHSGQIHSLAFSPNGKVLASGGTCKGNQVNLWDTATGRNLQALNTGEGVSGWSVAFSPDGRQLAAGGMHDTVRLWDIATGKEILQFKDRDRIIWSFAFSPDGKTLATANTDNTIGVWDAANGKELRRLTKPKLLPKVYMDYVAFSPDGKSISSGGPDGSVYLWDAATGRERLTMPGHDKWRNPRGFTRDGPALVVFSPDGKYLAAGGFAPKFQKTAK